MKNIINLNAIFVVEDYGAPLLPDLIIEENIEQELLRSFGASEVITTHVDVLKVNTRLNLRIRETEK